MGKDWAKGQTKENNNSIKINAEKHTGMIYKKDSGKKSFKSMDKEELESFVKRSTSFRDLVIKIYGVANSGSRDKAIKDRVKSFGIDTSHFTGKRWNAGKTKETHPSLEKAGKQYKKGLVDGKFKPSFLGKKISVEHRNKIIEFKKLGNFKFVKLFPVYSKYENSELYVQGTWEKKYAEWLNKSNVLWTKKHDLRIRYTDDSGIKRYYHPDFYLPEINEYIEIKGYYPEKCKRKMELVIQQNSDKKFIILMKDELKALGIL
jgi:hypothetical protein